MRNGNKSEESGRIPALVYDPETDSVWVSRTEWFALKEKYAEAVRERDRLHGLLAKVREIGHYA